LAKVGVIGVTGRKVGGYSQVVGAVKSAFPAIRHPEWSVAKSKNQLWPDPADETLQKHNSAGFDDRGHAGIPDRTEPVSPAKTEQCLGACFGVLYSETEGKGLSGQNDVDADKVAA
jgi:hypothetical protein